MLRNPLFTLLLVSALLTGCKLIVITPPGGSVSTASGTYGCAAGSVCEINITDLLFNETFNAVAGGGYAFSHWASGPNRICALSADGCLVDSALAAGNAQLLALLASGDQYYLEPIFQPVTGLGDATISGIVFDETIVVLVNADGYILDLTSSFNRAPDTNVGGGTNNAFSFAFEDVPSGEALRLYIIERRRIQGVFGDTGSTFSNVFSLDEGADVAVGVLTGDFFDVGEGAAQFDLLQQAGVTPLPIERTYPLGLDRPPVTGMDPAALVVAGSDALSIGWTGGAKSYLEQAVRLTDPGESNDADTARFLLAFASLGYAGTDWISDGNSADLSRLGDILDVLGLPDDRSRNYGYGFDLPESLDQSLITAETLSDFLEDRFRREVGAARRLMKQVSPNFEAQWIRPDDGEVYEADFGDAAFFTGLFDILLFHSELADAYVGVSDINQLTEDQGDNNPDNNPSVETVLTAETELASLEDTAALARSKERLLLGIRQLLMALDSINAETDAQDDDLLRVNALELEGDDYDRSVSFLKRLRDSIRSGETLIEQAGGPDGIGEPDYDLVLNLQQFFDVGVDLRGDDLLPKFMDNNVDDTQPCLADPTFNGVIISPDVNNRIYPGAECE